MSLDALLATFNLTKSQVTPTEKLFLLACARRAGESHECWPSIARLCADTGFDRKTVIKLRQSVIAKNLMVYDDKSMRGKSGKIPIMRLTYVDKPVDNSSDCQSNNPKSGTIKPKDSPKSGTVDSPKSGTHDSTTFGTLNSKHETINEKSAPATTAKTKKNPPPAKKSGSELTYINENFQPNADSLKKLHEISEKKGIDTVELHLKFVEVHRRYNTRSRDWQKTFIEFLEREAPQRAFLAITAKKASTLCKVPGDFKHAVSAMFDQF